MATTANKNCKQFIGVVYGEDGITSRIDDEPGKGIVKLQTAVVNENESNSEETVEEIAYTGSTDIEVRNQTRIAYPEGAEVEIWQDGYGVFWLKSDIPDLEGWAEEDIEGFDDEGEYQIKLARGIKWNGEKTILAGSSLLNFNSTIETGTPVLCRWFPNLLCWIVIEAACEPDPNYVPSSEEEEEEEEE